MPHTVFCNVMKVAVFGALLTGCGLTQTVGDATSSAASSIFNKQVKTLHLDFSGRAAINTDKREMTALSLPTVVRVYQLRDNLAMDKASYDSVLSNASNLLRADQLAQHAMVVQPEEGAQMNMPLDKDARFVTVVALFRTPDTQLNTWRLTLSRDDLDPDRARIIDLGNSRLTLQPLTED